MDAYEQRMQTIRTKTAANLVARYQNAPSAQAKEQIFKELVNISITDASSYTLLLLATS